MVWHLIIWYRDNVNAYRLRNTENKLVLSNLELIILTEVFRTAELSCGTTYL